MNSSKAKKGFKETLKTFFSISKDEGTSASNVESGTSSGIGGIQRRTSAGVHRRSASISAYISASMLKSISPGADTSTRLKVLKELEPLVSTKLLEDFAVENLWLCVQDLVNSTDFVHKRAGVEFIIAICKGQASRMGLCRLMFFEYLKTAISVANSINDVDPSGNFLIILYADLLNALSRDGHDVNDFEEDIGSFTLAMLYEYLRRGVRATAFLRLLQNLIKYHAVYFDDEAMRNIVRYICIDACRTKTDDDEASAEIISCLLVMDAILQHGCWPKGVLTVVVTALCKLINLQSVAEQCWAFTRQLLNSPYGHGTVLTMCNLMQATEMYPDEGFLRGAIFFVGASLWGPEHVENLRHTPGAVLPFFLQSLSSNSAVVAYEVALSIQRLVSQYGADLQLMTWDLILKIVEGIFEVANSNCLPPACAVAKTSHDTLTMVEKLYDDHRFNGSSDQLFNLVEKLAKHRPEASILCLMTYRTQSLSPCKGNWLSQLHALLDTYYNRDSRQSIRAEAVRILRNVFLEYRHLLGDELVEVVVLSVFGEVDRESDYEMQASVINLLVDMAKTSAQNSFFELLAVLERVINTKLKSMDIGSMNGHDQRQIFNNMECALGGLIEIAKVKWNCTPSSEALQIIDLLTAHILLQYWKNLFSELGGSARWTVLKFLLSLGVEIGTQRLTYKECMIGRTVVSAYIICVDSDQDPSPPHSPLPPNSVSSGRITNFSAKDVIKALSRCVQKERKWAVLKWVLNEMPAFLLNRRLALSDTDGIGAICTAAIRLATNPRNALAITDNLTAEEVKEQVYPLLTALIPFRSYFDEGLQRKLAYTIQNGVENYKSGPAVVSTINCLFEMPDIMERSITDLVRRLSQLPSAPTIAIPVMELLSTLMRMDQLYKEFKLEDYQNVLKTLTAYVDPFMMTDFIVAIAYQIIFRWFLRAPLQVRPRLAQYALDRISDIMKKNLENNEKSLDDPLLRKAYEDAREVCFTFFAYYSFTDDPPDYERSAIAGQLFDQNRSRHWIIGDRLFSITPSAKTDGCGICKQKQQQAQIRQDLTPPPSWAQRERAQTMGTTRQQFLEKRRRHASAIQGRVTGTPELRHRSAADDICIGSVTASTESVFGKTDGTGGNDPNRRCLCWCGDWMELTIRHAIGRQAWVVRTCDGQNTTGPTMLDSLLSFVIGDTEEQEVSEREELGLIREDSIEERNPISGTNSNSTSLASSMFSINDDPNPIVNGGNNEKMGWILGANPSIPNPAVDVRLVLFQLFSSNISLDPNQRDQIGIHSLSENEAVERAIKNLDRISAYETHKIGVIYIGPRQTTESEILANQFGSPRYEKFLSGLGKLINLKETDPSKIYIGGLETSGKDGEFTYHWSDQTSQVIFHVATRMPNRENDTNFQQKKLHIGNDFVSIVFNESGCDYQLSTISGQFARVAVVVQPLDDQILHIKLVAKKEISSWLAMKEATMSDELAPLLCRQMAIRADASARIWEEKKSTPSGEPVVCRTAERLRQIKSIKERFAGKALTVSSMFE